MSRAWGLALIGVAFVGVMATAKKEPTHAEKIAAVSRDLKAAGRIGVAEPAPPPPAPAQAPTWTTSTDTDPLTGKAAHHVYVDSMNSHAFEFPYGGGTMAKLVVRRHPQYGRDVIVQISKGQVLCRSSNCPVGWRVDDRPVRVFEGNAPSDHDSTVVFLGRYNTLTADLKGAKRLIVQLNIYKEGSRAWEFDVSGFSAP